MIDKLVENLVAMADGRGNAGEILSSGFYLLDVAPEYTMRGIMTKVLARGEIKDMPFELADAIVGEGYAKRYTASGCTFYPVSRVVGGTTISIVCYEKS